MGQTSPSQGEIQCRRELFNNNSISRIDIYFRESAGALLYGLSKFSYYNYTLPKAEALSMFEVITFAAANSMNFVIFESDCKLVVDSINLNSTAHNEFGDTSRCKDLLPTHNDYIMRFVRRQANKIVHSIVRAPLSHPSPTFSMRFLPICTDYYWWNELDLPLLEIIIIRFDIWSLGLGGKLTIWIW